MFSDQDDIWIENKLEKYIEITNSLGKKQFLIHSDAILCDINKNILKKTFISKRALKTGLENIFFNYFVQGATVLITKELKEFILPFPDEVYLHDRYIHLMTELFFERIFINESLLYYRQHANNQVGATNTLKELLNKRYFDERDYKLIKKLYNKYNGILKEEKRNLIRKYFKILDVKSSKLRRFLELKKSDINMSFKKQISLLIKG